MALRESVGRGDAAHTKEQARSFADLWQTAWNSRVPERVAGLCTEDVIWEDPATEGAERGRPAVIAYLTSLWRTFPDMTLTWAETPYLASDGGRVACHWRMTGTMLGSLQPQGFAPTGGRLETEGVDLFELRAGLVCRYQGFFDTRAMGQQLGLLPGTGSRAERVAVRLQRLGARLRRVRA